MEFQLWNKMLNLSILTLWVCISWGCTNIASLKHFHKQSSNIPKVVILHSISQFFGSALSYKKAENHEELSLVIFELLVGEGLVFLNMIENIWMRSFVWFHITQIYQSNKHYFLWWNVCIQGICFVSCECCKFNHDYIQPLDEKRCAWHFHSY